MPIEPADELLARASDSTAWAAAIEAHLDEHPLPADAAEVDRIASRVQARIHQRQRRPMPWLWLGAAVLAVAAAVLLWSPAANRVQPVPTETLTAPAVLVPNVDVLRGPRVERDVLVLEPGTEVLRTEQGPTTVILVQEGTVRTPAQEVPAKHWVLTTEVEGALEQVVFPDGQAPPTLNGDVWPASVQGQLRAVRWRSLPDETLSTLDTLLEAP